MRSIDPDGKWIVLLYFKLAQMVIAMGPPVPNGNKIVPDFSFWHQLDRDRVGAPVYNRYAKVSASSPKIPQLQARVCSITTATFFSCPPNCLRCERSGAATFYFRQSGRELSNMVLLRCTPTGEARYLFTNDYRPRGELVI
jgi:hypothetical protein